ncbi:uncharacterized protein PHALS_12159 [Plasmopara halstedii]|uniref:Uncharacterized protein n=1 Tax=Plasmopara halstedii TaxID=4781 RepID=A0A0P1AL24_PLAHL|nr:uncharacterized protein PHALS_12159 [Plasmopara halstedii]CEG41842.1 hypothetical protein PHALS_12159 [Plasmopara halstedii]|eukprot:XP_024578211.1 hypothetical protein PHALS_12159 [Plasmopara halstedii]
MITIPATSCSPVRRHILPSRGEAWRPLSRTTAVFATSIDLKRQQTITTQHEHKKLDNAISDQSKDAQEQRPASRKRTSFLSMVFPESGNDEESDYAPSEEEESEEEDNDCTSDEDSPESLLVEPQEETMDTEEDSDDDIRWWKSDEDKRQWEKRFRQADATFRSKFGLSIDTPAQPEIRRRLKLKKSLRTSYKIVLLGVVILSLVQLALVYSASSWAFSMVAWQPFSFENVTKDEALVGWTIDGHADTDVTVAASNARLKISDHVRTGLYLCSTLSRRVVTSERDVMVTQHALRACDIAVTLAPLNSYEAIEAHVLRGDLRSLLMVFDGADEDYKDAMKLVQKAEVGSCKLMPEPELMEYLDLKVVVNHWTQLYSEMRFKELRREAKLRAATGEVGNAVNAMIMLALDWISAFKGKQSVLDVLTHQRSWTLRHLNYHVSNGDESGND